MIENGGEGGLWDMGDGRDFCQILQEGGGFWFGCSLVASSIGEKAFNSLIEILV